MSYILFNLLQFLQTTDDTRLKTIAIEHRFCYSDSHKQYSKLTTQKILDFPLYFNRIFNDE